MTSARQRVQRFETLDDLDRFETTVEEREDYEPHLRLGLTVFAGVDYEAVVAAAEREGELIVWDGGNNDFSFVRPDLEIVVVDPFRPGHETSYHPGRVNLRRADVVVVNKVGSAPAENVAAVVAAVRLPTPARPSSKSGRPSVPRPAAKRSGAGGSWSRTSPRNKDFGADENQHRSRPEEQAGPAQGAGQQVL